MEDNNIMFPHFSKEWVNLEGNKISSYMLLLSSAYTKDEITISVQKGPKKVNITFAFPNLIMTKEMAMAPSGLYESHANVTSFISMFEQVKEKLYGKQKTTEMNLALIIYHHRVISFELLFEIQIIHVQAHR